MSYVRFFTCTDEKMLPIMHTTQELFFRKMLRDGIIEKKMCPVFSEELAYYFYGRPAYRVKSQDEDRVITGNIPCILIINKCEIPGIKKIYPFDTGAYRKYVESGYIHKDIDISEFNLGNNPKIIADHVLKYWETQQDYVDYNTDKMKRSLALKDDGSPDFMLLEMYLKLLATTRDDGSKIDDRCGTVEISVSENYLINWNDIIGIVIPNTLVDTAAIQGIVKSNPQLIIKTYKPNKRKISEYQSELDTKAVEILKERAII